MSWKVCKHKIRFVSYANAKYSIEQLAYIECFSLVPVPFRVQVSVESLFVKSNPVESFSLERDEWMAESYRLTSVEFNLSKDIALYNWLQSLLLVVCVRFSNDDELCKYFSLPMDADRIIVVFRSWFLNFIISFRFSFRFSLSISCIKG